MRDQVLQLQMKIDGHDNQLNTQLDKSDSMKENIDGKNKFINSLQEIIEKQQQQIMD